MESPLVLGLGLPVSGSWATPDRVALVARRAEELGYGSLWTFQRLLAPNPSEWGPQYRSVLDPIVSLAFAAAVTERVRLGTAVVNAPFLPAVVLAKQLATVDVLSAGRLDVGLGLGWVPAEFEAVGAPYGQRVARTTEAVTVLRSLWSEGAADGFAPAPVQRPGPPILLGGTAQPALRRVGRIADGWISSSRQDLSAIGTAIGTVRDAAVEAGRDVERLRYVVRGLLRLDEEVPDEHGRRTLLTGSAEQVRADLATLADSGVTEVFLDLNFNPHVGSPDVDPGAATDLALRSMQALAPGV